MKKYLAVLAAVALIAGGLLVMSGCSSRDAELVGTWEWELDSSIATTFNTDGSGRHSMDWAGYGETFTWSTSGNNKTWNYPGHPRMRSTYSISGDVLTMTFDDGSLRFNRVP